MLQFEPDFSLADWFAQRDEPWEQLVTMGPCPRVALGPNVRCNANQCYRADSGQMRMLGRFAFRHNPSRATRRRGSSR